MVDENPALEQQRNVADVAVVMRNLREQAKRVASKLKRDSQNGQSSRTGRQSIIILSHSRSFLMNGVNNEPRPGGIQCNLFLLHRFILRRSALRRIQSPKRTACTAGNFR